MEGKTTLSGIKEKYRFIDTNLAGLADVDLAVIERMLQRKPVARWQAEQVLEVLSVITEENYSIDTVDVVLAET